MGVAVQVEPSVERFVSAPVRKMLIDGKWVEAASGKTFETINPATGEVLARVAEGDAEDVDRAAQAPRGAPSTTARGRAWRPRERESILLKVADLIEKHGDELAQLETLDNGKSLVESRTSTSRRRRTTFRYYAGWVNKIDGETNPDRPGVLQLHAARAGRRLRADHPVELPAADGGVEARPRARLRQHGRAQARRADAAHGAAPRRAAARSGRAGRASSTSSPASARPPAARSCATR